MKLLSVKAQNFGSYSHLEHDFSNIGLALVYGATGSGKSTLQDLAPWVLFNETAKGGNADDVRSWTSPDEPTSVTLEVEVKGSVIEVTRIRGKTTQNDLYWLERGSDQLHRGKDLNDTQRLLNDRLGVNGYFYTIGAYYNEFSPTGTFFTAKASARRELFETLVNLDLPVKLSNRISNAKREAKKANAEILEKFNKIEGRLDYLKKREPILQRDADSWEAAKKAKIAELQLRSANFEKEKESKIAVAKLKEERYEITRQANIQKIARNLERKLKSIACTSCSFIDEALKAELEQSHLDQMTNEESYPNSYTSECIFLNTLENNYLAQILHESSLTNHVTDQLKELQDALEGTMNEHHSLNLGICKLEYRLSSLDQLSDIVDKLRGELLKKTIKEMEVEVNRYLETYFDSEIRCAFNLEGSDKLEVLIWKSGHECSYRQLSKGQRSLLKLCFSVTAMKFAANKAGVHFDTVMFDEALDGQDAELKMKAFNLFSELAKTHDSVLVIDHSEGLQNLFDKKFLVTIDSDISTIREV